MAKLTGKAEATGSRARWLVLAIFAVAFVGLEVGSYTRMSATWDEPGHLTAGYAALKRHDYRVDPEHPPFLRMWAALPLVGLQGIKLDTTEIDRTEPNAWALGNVSRFAHGFLYRDNDADRLLAPARFMMVLLGVALGVLIFCWVKEWFGLAAATIALVFYTFEPNLAAHSSLVTTDLGATCFMFGTMYFLWRVCQRPSTANVAGLTAFFALAMVSKFSAMVLAPIILVVLALAVFYGRTLKIATFSAIILLLACSSWVAIWAVYGFRYAPSDAATWLYHYQDNPIVQQRVPLLSELTGWIDRHRLLPNVFTEGFLLGQAKAQTRPAFFAGRYSHDGWWYYFPAAFGLKTPVAAIVLSFCGVALSFKRWRTSGFERSMFVLLPVAVYMIVAVQSHLNVGLRHILPIYPFVLLLAVSAARELITAGRTPGRLLVVVVSLLWVGEYGRAYPSPLTFFNVFAGGPSNGYKYLADSNLDWGQDLKALKKWMDRNSVAHINLSYFGSADPDYYQITCTYLPGSPNFVAPELVREPRLPGYVAISATNLDGVYLREHDFYQPLREQKPVANIGNSIFVYWVASQWW